MGEYVNKKPQTDAMDDKKIVPRANGTIKKKGEVTKFADIFLAGDVNSAKDYVIKGVIIPAIKKAILDVIINGTDILLYGETGHIKTSSLTNKVPYSNCYNNSNNFNRNSGNSGAYSYDDIIFSSRGEAEIVLDGLNEIISQYGFASVADLYELANITNNKYTDNNYGWSERISTSPALVSEGYILRLPRVIPINK